MRGCFWFRLAILLTTLSITVVVSAQTVINGSVHITQTLPDSVNYQLGQSSEQFTLVVPDGYNPLNPPALLIGGHSLGAGRSDFPQPFIDTASAWGWMCLSIDGVPLRTDGSGYTHWFSHRVINNLDRVLDTIATMFPFNPDSIYFAGGSMGAAAGMQYHHYHLDPNGYMLAGTASGSGILDLLRRVREQLAAGARINGSMHIEFGPADTVPTACVNYKYKFNSAVVTWDTTNSRHYNLSWLPVYFSAGIQEPHDTVAVDLLNIYGSHMRAETLATQPGASHGWPNLNADTTMHWLRRWGKTYRHPTFQNVASDSARRCYDIEFLQQRNDTCVSRAFAYFDSMLVGNTWYLTNPRLTLMRNASKLRLYRFIPNSAMRDTLTVANLDTASDTLYIRYPANVLPGSWLFTLIPPRVGSHWDSQNHEYFIPAISRDSNLTIYGVYQVDQVAMENALPEGYTMSVFPNPFNGMATIRFNLPRGSAMDLSMYDVSGRLVKEFPRKSARSQSSVYFSLPSEGLASGSYFLQGRAGSKTLLHRVTVLK